MNSNKFIVVGGGLAGLMTAMKLAEAGYHVDIFSIVPCRRSHSVCAQGGINASVNTKGEGDSPQIHFEETIYGGDFLANQPMVKGMCEAAPEIVYLFDRLGVAFNRTPEGLIDFRRFGGTKFHRTAFAGSTTGQQMMYALDEQVRRFETEGLVKRYEGWEFLSAVLDDTQTARGIVAIDLVSLELKTFRADAVILCTGGVGMIYGRSTNSTICTGSAAGSVFRQGVWYANGEFIQVHPTTIPGEDKNRLMSEAIRGEGGRVWTIKDGKPWYFLEEMYPKYGNLVPRDIASRAIFKVCRELKLGIDGKDLVYLDISHLDPKALQTKLGGVIEIYEKFVGEDPAKVPMRVFPSVHYTMGGMYIDSEHATNVPGIFAAGECEYQYHGANRLGANSLLSCIYGGELAAKRAERYAKSLQISSGDVSSKFFDHELRRQREMNGKLIGYAGKENPYLLWEEMAKWMTDHVTVIRKNNDLKKTDQKLIELTERSKDINLHDSANWVNQALIFTRELENMLVLARVITLGALARNESRGSHYKPDFPDRNDKEWLKTTVAKWTPKGIELSYESVDTSLIQPRERKY
ncbi:MAG: succinate dehydrogenase flavoprotein subunit [Omnitrophica bacterium RIFCSPHIGHO2_02_FULL_46_11]|nr:MAG: succinate dehydrogenase flavoprotein subunit [Omnitrophica bacterium RIFCSPHIGHO2_02_FULL_46_11]